MRYKIKADIAKSGRIIPPEAAAHQETDVPNNTVENVVPIAAGLNMWRFFNFKKCLDKKAINIAAVKTVLPWE